MTLGRCAATGSLTLALPALGACPYTSPEASQRGSSRRSVSNLAIDGAARGADLPIVAPSTLPANDPAKALDHGSAPHVTLWLLMKSSDALDAVFGALAHRERRQMLDIVMTSPGCGVSEVAAHFAMSRIGVLKHLNLLEEAGLLTSEKRGRVRHLYFNAVPIQEIHQRWTDRYSALFANRMVAVKERIENRKRKRSRERA